MFSTLCVTVDGNPETSVQPTISRVAIRGTEGIVSINNLGAKQEDIRSGVARQYIDMFEHNLADRIGLLLQEEVDVDVNGQTPLEQRSVFCMDQE